MRSIALLLTLVPCVALAQPAKGKAADKKDAKPGLASVVKPPPMPPQLDNTLFADPATAKWAPVETLPKGAQGALVGTEAANGGMAGWLKLPAGYKMPTSTESHIHTYTIVAGQVTVTSNGEKHAFGPGGYVVLTGRDKYDVACGSAECLLLVRHYGPPDLHAVAPNEAPKAR